MRAAAPCLAICLILGACMPAAAPEQDEPDGSTTLPPLAMKGLIVGPGTHIRYTCGEDVDASIILFADERVAQVELAGPGGQSGFLQCAPTRVGPECINGSFRALINTVTNTATFSDNSTGLEATCAEVQSE